MTPDTAPEAITQTRMAEMLALAPLQPAEPPKDRVFYARQHVPMKWTPYKPTSQEVKRGKKGRWQQRRAYGLGWENSDEEPQAGAWIEDVINHPDRRLTSHSAGEGLLPAEPPADWLVAMAGCAPSPDDPASIANAYHVLRFCVLTTPPSDAGSTTRSGGEGVVPDGWKLVPLKATDEMVSAWWLAASPVGCGFPGYAAMLAAAPDPFATTPSPDASPDSGKGLRDQIARDAALFAALPASEQSALRRELATVGYNPSIVFGPSPSPAIVKGAGEVEDAIYNRKYGWENDGVVIRDSDMTAAREITAKGRIGYGNAIRRGEDFVERVEAVALGYALARAALSASNAAQVSK